MNPNRAEILIELTYQGIHHLPQHLPVHCLCYCCLGQCAMTAAVNEAVQCHYLCCPESSEVQSVSDSLLLFAVRKSYNIFYYQHIQLLRENISRKTGWTLQPVSTGCIFLLVMGNSARELLYTTLTPVIDSGRIIENVINVYSCKMILLPAFH